MEGMADALALRACPDALAIWIAAMPGSGAPPQGRNRFDPPPRLAGDNGAINACFIHERQKPLDREGLGQLRLHAGRPFPILRFCFPEVHLRVDNRAFVDLSKRRPGSECGACREWGHNKLPARQHRTPPIDQVREVRLGPGQTDHRKPRDLSPDRVARYAACLAICCFSRE